MSPTIEIRSATIADAEHLSALILELGYAISPQQLRDKLAGMQPSRTDQAFVATAGDRLLGCISLHALPLFHAVGKLGRITSLVVSATHRGQGIGTALLTSSHAWFESAGCTKFEVTSGDQRGAAHRFYESHGYHRDGQRLSRLLSS